MDGSSALARVCVAIERWTLYRLREEEGEREEDDDDEAKEGPLRSVTLATCALREMVGLR
jgi:hypothetical protein